MKHERVMTFFACAMSIAAVASAQDNPRVGLAMGYPAAVVLVWHPTEAVGIRPEFLIAGGSSKTTSALSHSSNGTTNLQMNFALAALFYGASHDNLRIFISPAFTLQRSSSSLPAVVTNAVPDSTYAYGARGSMGAEYAVSRRFSAFGEVGMGYAHQSNSNPGGASSASAWSLRSGVGVILYF